MKLIVVGASRGTGARCVEAALTLGHAVTAFARTPDRLVFTHPDLTKVSGDYHDAASVSAAVAGHDAVIVCAGSRNQLDYRHQPDYFSRGVRHCIDAMQEHAVPRLVVLSAFGVGDSYAAAPWFWRYPVIKGVLRRPYADHAVEERLVVDSGLDHVIARPTRLTDGPATGAYTATTGFDVPMSISRKDVADFLVRSCASDAFLNQAVQLGG